MLIRQVLDLFDLLDSPKASGKLIREYFLALGAEDVRVTVLGSGDKTTDCICIFVRGENGKASGGKAPTLAILGRLGGVGARPERIGFVSDGDGCLAALAAGAKLVDMMTKTCLPFSKARYSASVNAVFGVMVRSMDGSSAKERNNATLSNTPVASKLSVKNRATSYLTPM